MRATIKPPQKIGHAGGSEDNNQNRDENLGRPNIREVEPDIPLVKKYVIAGTYQEYLDFVEKYEAEEDSPETILVNVMGWGHLKMFHPVHTELILTGTYESNPIYKELLGMGQIENYQQYMSLEFLNQSYNPDGVAYS